MTNFHFEGKTVIVFDLDGTIVDLAVDWHELKKFLSERYSNLYEGANCEFKTLSKCLSFIVERDDENELKNFFDIIRQRELEGIKNSSAIKETVFFIKNLELFGISTSVKLAVLSLNTRDCIKESLALARVLDKFDLIVGREDVRKWKPDPEGLLIIKKHYKVNTEEMIFIGDMQKDIQTGKNAGIDAIFISEIINMVNETSGT